jgi:hypothetical protein
MTVGCAGGGFCHGGVHHNWDSTIWPIHHVMGLAVNGPNKGHNERTIIEAHEKMIGSDATKIYGTESFL